MPIGGISGKSFFKSQGITANIACILNELKHFDRLTNPDVRIYVGRNFILTS